MPGTGHGGRARRLVASVVLLFVASTVALAAHDAPPLVTAVARAAEVALPAPLSTPAPATASLSVPAVSIPPVTVPGVSVPGVPVTIPPVEVTVPPVEVTVPPIPPPTAPPTTAAPAPARPATGISPYLGLGTWVDVYDWSHTYTGGKPTVVPDDVDRMAAAGVQTLYIQATKHDAPTVVLEPDLLGAHIARAKREGIQVVVWYLPTLVDPARDLERLKAVAALRGIDGVAVDIEARNVPDINVRNDRLIELSAAFRQALPGRTIAGIVLPPVVLEVINPSFWPAFPYREIAPSYDVWMTMGYWTNRTDASGYRDAYRYTKENVDRLRNNLGQPDAPVHPIGGIGHRTSAGDIEQYKRAVTAVGGIGGSIYDWHTTAAALWANLRPMRLN